jgi:hypothetical protein
MWWMKFMLMDKKGDGDAGGSGGGSGDGKGDKGDAGKPDHGKELSDLKASNAALMARLEKLEAGGKPKEKDDDDLEDRARKDREAKESKDKDTRALESALKFNLGAKDWLKTNASLLPKDIEGIFAEAEKENFGSAMEKDAAIKSSIVQSFYRIQANLDLLTPSQKSALEDFLKLTKNGKQEKAQQIYENIFEPNFEMLKRVKKAEQLAKDNSMGLSTGTDADQAYRDRLMKLSKKHYLGEKDAT